MTSIHYTPEVKWVAEKIGRQYYPNYVGGIVMDCTIEDLLLIVKDEDAPQAVLVEIPGNRHVTAEILDLVFPRIYPNTAARVVIAGHPNSSDDLIERLCESEEPNVRDTARSVRQMRAKSAS